MFILTIIVVVTVIVLPVLFFNPGDILPFSMIRNYPYNKSWDKKLKQLMAEHTFRERTLATVKLGLYTIWCANHPYASFRPTGTGEFFPAFILPSRRTVMQAWKKLNRECPLETMEDKFAQYEVDVVKQEQNLEQNSKKKKG